MYTVKKLRMELPVGMEDCHGRDTTVKIRKNAFMRPSGMPFADRPIFLSQCCSNNCYFNNILTAVYCIVYTI